MRTETAEIRKLPDSELEERLAGNREELFNLKFQAITEPIKNPAQIHQLKKEIAQVLTILQARKIGIEEVGLSGLDANVEVEDVAQRPCTDTAPRFGLSELAAVKVFVGFGNGDVFPGELHVMVGEGHGAQKEPGGIVIGGVELLSSRPCRGGSEFPAEPVKEEPRGANTGCVTFDGFVHHV